MRTNLRLGDQGVGVQLLQLALNRGGFRTEIDGIFGPETCRNVQAFFRTSDACNITEKEWEQLIPFIKGYVDYKVQKGDTLWRIAEAYRTNVARIISANPGIQPEFLQIGDVIRLPFAFPVVSTQVNTTSELVEYEIDGLLVRYPFLKKERIGRSVMGKDINCIRIGTGPIEIFYSATYHANEWITTPVLLKFLEDYAECYLKGRMLGTESALSLYRRYSLYIVPLVNPDGVDLVNGVLDDEEYLEEAEKIADEFPEIRFPAGWKANIEGIDLNLQFPAGWEDARRIKYAQGYTMPAPRDFVGEAPLVAPESKAIYDFTRMHDFRLVLAYHTQGKVIYWKYKDYTPMNAEDIAEEFARVSGYKIAETPGESANAGYKDWFIQEYDSPGYTIEAGIGENPLSLQQFPEIYKDNFGILLGGMINIS